MNQSLPNMDPQVQQLFATGQHQEAASHLARAAAQDTRYLSAMRQWGRTLLEQQDYEAAVAIFEAWVSLEPRNPKAFNALSVALTMAGDLDRALAIMERNLELDRDNRSVFFNMAKLHMLRGEWQRAEGRLEQILKAHPQADNQEVHEMLAHCREQEGLSYWDPDSGENPLQGMPPFGGGMDSGQVGESFAPPADVVSLRTEAEPQITSRPEPRRVRTGSGGGMQVLMIQHTPGLRACKLAAGLAAQGHDVRLAHVAPPNHPALPLEAFSRIDRFERPQDLWHLSRDRQIIHSLGPSDMWTVAALAGDIPVVHDAEFLPSLIKADDRSLAYFEVVAQKGADARVFGSTGLTEAAAMVCPSAQTPTLVIPNLPLAGMIVDNPPAKLSASDGRPHVAYLGTGPREIASADGWLAVLRGLAQAGYGVHVFASAPSPEVEKSAAEFPSFNLYPAALPQEVAPLLARCDATLVGSGATDFELPHALFDSQAAGVPVLVPRVVGLSDHVYRNKCGSVFDELEEIPQVLAGLKGTTVRPPQTMEAAVEDLVALYTRLAGIGRRARAAA